MRLRRKAPTEAGSSSTSTKSARSTRCGLSIVNAPGTFVLVALTVLAFWSFGNGRVEVSDGTFRAGRAHIPVGHLADPVALDRDGTRRVAGVDADARAFLVLRPYIATSVRVRVVDPADPTPYWLVSTRHPAALAAALTVAISAQE